MLVAVDWPNRNSIQILSILSSARLRSLFNGLRKPRLFVGAHGTTVFFKAIKARDLGHRALDELRRVTICFPIIVIPFELVSNSRSHF